MYGSAFQASGAGVYRPYPAVQLSQPRPGLPVGDPPVYCPPPYAVAALHLDAYQRDWSVQLQTQRLPTMPIGGVPVSFPTPPAVAALHLDAYQRDWFVQLQTQRIPLLPVGDPAALFSLAGYPSAYFAAPFPGVATAQRLPITPPAFIPPPAIPFPTPQAAYALLWPAYQRDWSVQLLMQRLLLLPVGDPPALYGLAGYPSSYFAAPFPGVQAAQRLPVTPQVVLPSGIAYPTPAQLYALLWPAFPRDWPVAYLQRLALLPVAGDSVTFPPPNLAPATHLRDWSVQLASQRLLLLPVGAPPIAHNPVQPAGRFVPPRWPQASVMQRLPLIPPPAPVFTLLALQATDYSGPLYVVTDASGARYVVLELGGARYIVNDT